MTEQPKTTTEKPLPQTRDIEHAIRFASSDPGAFITRERQHLSGGETLYEPLFAWQARAIRRAVQPYLAQVWQSGYTSGHSNAMRYMSDEPNVPTTPNPYEDDTVWTPKAPSEDGA